MTTEITKLVEVSDAQIAAQKAMIELGFEPLDEKVFKVIDAIGEAQMAFDINGLRKKLSEKQQNHLHDADKLRKLGQRSLSNFAHRSAEAFEQAIAYVDEADMIRVRGTMHEGQETKTN